MTVCVPKYINTYFSVYIVLLICIFSVIITYCWLANSYALLWKILSLSEFNKLHTMFSNI